MRQLAAPGFCYAAESRLSARRIELRLRLLRQRQQARARQTPPEFHPAGVTLNFNPSSTSSPDSGVAGHAWLQPAARSRTHAGSSTNRWCLRRLQKAQIIHGRREKMVLPNHNLTSITLASATAGFPEQPGRRVRPHQ
jgi:hypothetical protein